MSGTDPPPFHRAMVVVAHPDDAEFGSAGTVAKWADEGVEVTYVICTDGGAGSADPSLSREELPPIREREQRAAAAVLGVRRVEFLGHPDGELVADIGLRRELTRLIRRHRPDRLICQNAVRTYSNIYGNHPDHLAAGQAAMEAVYPASRNPHAFPELLAQEGLAPHVVRELWVTGTDAANHYEDISGTVDRKLEALRQHRSQLPAGQDVGTRVRARLAEAGRQIGVAAAESFRRLTSE